ncbi:MAG: ATP phosphoribosyltransferase [Taibaiella sp.]|nr:ATP phosphoribosyltransferase [Taibaiella sp.]
MSRLKIAIQKSGRLNEASLSILRECGIIIPNGTGKLIAESSNFPIDILFLRDDDIPQYVHQKVADLGIVGENVLFESRKQVLMLKKLGIAKCRLSLAIPKDIPYNSIHFFSGKTIATSYPFMLRAWLDQYKVEAQIEEISGSVEIVPGLGLAAGICDIVSSGSTLFSNGLKEVELVMKSEAVLIGTENIEAAKKTLLQQLLFRIDAVLSAKGKKYILLNTPNDKIDAIIQILPGMKSPTILPLAEKGWSSLHSVIDEDQFWDHIDELKKAGAEGILVVPIEKMIQ